MNTTIARTISVILFAAFAATASAQSAAISVHSESEEGLTLKPGRAPKRVITAPRSPEVRAFAFSGGHPFGAERGAQTMIVQTGEYDPKAAEALREDMAVMARILQKTCADFASEHERVMGLDILIHGGRSRNLFIEDYGALFTLNVDIPLRAAEKGEGKKDDTAERANEEWENARNELFGPRRPLGEKIAGGPLREFRAEDVNRLRGDLIEALRNAANIRGLKDNHWVTVVVRGRADASPEGELYIGAGDWADGDSTMVLKVRKGELSSSAKGERGDLGKRVSVRIY